jgi:hypothetical protein
MTAIGPLPAHRDHLGSIATEPYVRRAKRCRDRALGNAVARLFGLIWSGRRPASAAPAALAAATPRSSTSATPAAENDDGRAHKRPTDAPGLVA